MSAVLNQVANLESTNFNLNIQLQSLQELTSKQKESMEYEIKALQNLLSALESEFALDAIKSKSEMESLKIEKEEFEQMFHQANSKLGSYENTVSNLENLLNEEILKREVIETYKIEINKTLEIEIEKRKSIESNQIEFSVMQQQKDDEIGTLREHIQSLEFKIRSFSNEHEPIEKCYSSMNEDISADVRGITRERDSALMRLKSAIRQRNIAQEECDLLHLKMEEKNAEISKLYSRERSTDELSRLQSDRDTMIQKLAAAQLTMAAEAKTTKRLREELSSLTEQLKNNEDRYYSDIKLYKLEIQRIQQENSRKSTFNNEDLESRILVLNSDIQKFQFTVQKISNELQVSKENLAKLFEDKTELQNHFQNHVFAKENDGIEIENLIVMNSQSESERISLQVNLDEHEKHLFEKNNHILELTRQYSLFQIRVHEIFDRGRLWSKLEADWNLEMEELLASLRNFQEILKSRKTSHSVLLENNVTRLFGDVSSDLRIFDDKSQGDLYTYIEKTLLETHESDITLNDLKPDILQIERSGIKSYEPEVLKDYSNLNSSGNKLNHQKVWTETNNSIKDKLSPQESINEEFILSDRSNPNSFTSTFTTLLETQENRIKKTDHFNIDSTKTVPKQDNNANISMKTSKIIRSQSKPLPTSLLFGSPATETGLK
ncbi:hypothetical protein HK096_007435 [Nowakowskiella sp. JEL0078]|nr:hypothetical protein HK096_007435 [Nowakowskiella sp. JEL0078]